MSQFKVGWYLIYTKPHHEKKVYTRLLERNINAFLPLTKRLRSWNDRKKYIDEPLFPSYVFIYLNDMQNFYEGIDAEGTLYYVKMGNSIARVNESVVNNLRIVTGKVTDLEVSENRFQNGRKLVISQGALTGLSCEVVNYDKKEKILVRVDLLRRNILLSLPEDHLLSA